MPDAIEIKRVKTLRKRASAAGDARDPYLQATWPRPIENAPPSSAPFPDREEWSGQFVPWYFSQTGGEIEHPDAPAGYRWRMEFFDCVADPQSFEKYAEDEILLYKAQGGE